MALTSSKLSHILERQQECERQTKLLQQQVEAFDSLFKTKPASKNNTAQSQSSANVTDGKYVVFVSMKQKPVAIDVIAAFLNAKKVLGRAGKAKDIILNLVDKDNEVIPRMLTPSPSKAQILGSSNVTRLLYRIAGREAKDVIKRTEIDSWIEKSIQLNKMSKAEFKLCLSKLNTYLELRSFLAGYDIEPCDLSLYVAMTQKKKDIGSNENGNVLRWLNTIEQSSLMCAAQKYVISAEKKSAAKKQNAQKQKKSPKKSQKQSVKEEKESKGDSGGSWDIGIDPKYNGNIVTRFPPEPSGFLHIGHAKAVFINWTISRQFKGKMIVRIDDTNPAKEKAEFEENILRDLQCLGVKPDLFTHTSDYFDYFIECCTRVISAGHAYCDLTKPLEMKEERSNRIENKYRTAQSKEENLRLWKEMIAGTAEGQTCCVRIRLDMKSDNGTLRDPTIYRCNVTDAHHMTGRKFKVYPTYDFACPIVDSLEGVTHAFRSKEYNERNEQYKLVWDIVCKGQSKTPKLPNMFQFSRLDFVRTVLSKRKLSKLIERGIVSGWDDPRLPTVQGIFRRGLQLEALNRFVSDQAMSVVNTEQEWDKIWSYNNEVLDPKVGRYFAVSQDRVVINIGNIDGTVGNVKSVPLAPPKYELMKGKTKLLEISNKVFVERFEIENAIEKNKKKNETRLILMNWGIVNLDHINYDSSNAVNRVISIDATFEKDNQNYKGKSAVNWVADNGLNNLVPIKLVELDYLFTYVERDNDFVLEESKNQTWFETDCLAESPIRLLSKGDIVQFIKFGCFKVDKPYLGRKSEPAILIYIPDGKEKAMSKIWQHLRKVSSGAGGKPKKKKNKKNKNKKTNKKNNKT